MTAESVHDFGARDPGDDPAAIFDMLPVEHRDRFRGEYDAALDAAHDLARYRQVAEVLRLWRLQAIAFGRPGYREAIQDAVDGREDRFVRYVPPSWEDRL